MRLLRIGCWSAAILATVLVALPAAWIVATGRLPMVRNVYRAFVPSSVRDSVPPDVPDLAGPAVLVFTKTNGFRHDEAIEEGARALAAIAARRGWSVYRTENGAVFAPGILERFRVVVWHNASGAPLDGSQREALRGWIEGGGGFVGVHAALDSSHESWEWYSTQVVGAGFIGHAIENQTAALRLDGPGHPVARGLEREWEHFDEWYSFDRSVRGDDGVDVLVSVDESTYEPRLKLLWIDEDLSMGDHPIVWTRSVGAGKALLCALGHVGGAYSDPSMMRILENGIEWAGGLGEGGSEAGLLRNGRDATSP